MIAQASLFTMKGPSIAEDTNYRKFRDWTVTHGGLSSARNTSERYDWRFRIHILRDRTLFCNSTIQKEALNTRASVAIQEFVYPKDHDSELFAEQCAEMKDYMAKDPAILHGGLHDNGDFWVIVRGFSTKSSPIFSRGVSAYEIDFLRISMSVCLEKTSQIRSVGT